MASIEFISDDESGIQVLTPVYNDWESASRLVSDLNAAARGLDLSVSIVMVNDGSTDDSPSLDELIKGLEYVESIEILHLVANFGHAKALAIGLAYLAAPVGAVGTIDEANAAEFTHRSTRPPEWPVVVMDSDGEDRPTDVPRLVEASRREPENIIVAHRSSRSEGRVFAAFYRLYKGLFRMLTGRAISFGNFCLIPPNALKRLVYAPELWRHLAASLVRSRLPVTKLSTNRGARYFGKSKMNFNSLIQHGLGAIAVDLDRVLVRIVVGLVTLVGVLTSGMVAVTAYRLGTDLATPGWATTVMSGLLVLLVQSAYLAFLLLFLDLKIGSAAPNTPAACHRQYIAKIEAISARAKPPAP